MDNSILLNSSITMNFTPNATTLLPEDAQIAVVESIWTATEVFFLLLVIFVTLLGVIGNILVICAWTLNAHISENPSNALILSLAVTDLMIASYAIPFSHVFKLVGRWIFGEAMKLVLVLVTQSAVLVSSYHLVLIAIDRYRLVRHGLEYIKDRTVRSVLEPLPWLWFFGLWEITPILVAWWPYMDLFSFDREIGDITTGKVWETIVHPTFVSLHLFPMAILPIMLVSVLYYKTFMELRRRLRKRLPNTTRGRNHIVIASLSSGDHSGHSGGITSGVNLSEDEDQEAGAAISLGRMNNEQAHKAESFGSTQEEMRKKKLLKCYEQERKTAKTLGILILAFLICWIPFLTVNLLYFVGVRVSDDAHWMTKFVGMANSCVNPVIYAFSSKDFNVAFKKILFRLIGKKY